MFKPKTLLKVISILFIITGVLGIVGTGISYAVLPQLGEIEGVDMSLIEEAYTPLNLIMSVISGVSGILAGIFGVSGKSFKWAVIFAGVYTAVLLVSVVQLMVGGLFTAFVILDFVLPILYWWGLYQSK